MSLRNRRSTLAEEHQFLVMTNAVYSDSQASFKAHKTVQSGEEDVVKVIGHYGPGRARR
jgi:hypothetical protein